MEPFIEGKMFRTTQIQGCQAKGRAPDPEGGGAWAEIDRRWAEPPSLGFVMWVSHASCTYQPLEESRLAVLQERLAGKEGAKEGERKEGRCGDVRRKTLQPLLLNRWASCKTQTEEKKPAERARETKPPARSHAGNFIPSAPRRIYLFPLLSFCKEFLLLTVCVFFPMLFPEER